MSYPIKFPATRAQLMAVASEPGPRQAADKLWKNDQPTNATMTLQRLYRKAGLAYPWGRQNAGTHHDPAPPPVAKRHKQSPPIIRARPTPGLLSKISDYPQDHEALNAIRPLAQQLAELFRKIYCPGCETISCDLCQVALEVAPFGKPLRLSRPAKP